MRKLGVFLLLLALAVPLAGLFGVLHNQVSYTVSPEYFTKFKFHQFHLLNNEVPERVRAAWVGFLASWWMGIPLGLLVAPFALLHRSARDTWRLGFRAYLVLIGFTATFALAGLAYGFWRTSHLDPSAYRGWYIPYGLQDLRRFLCAAYMHNSAYLGGLLGVVLAVCFHLFLRFRKSPEKSTAPAPMPPNIHDHY